MKRVSLKSQLHLVLILVFSLGVSSLHAKVRAVATTTMITDLVRQVGGDWVEVEGIMGPSVDPHLYKATASDVRRLRKADVIFYNGLFLEGKMGDVLVQLARQGKPVYAVVEGISENELLEPEEFEGHYDPHLWFDPRLWAKTIEVVVNGLIKVDPKNESVYRDQGKLVQSEYEALYQWGKERIKLVPEASRILITSHDAFNYFGRAFDFQVVAVQGISTVTEAGLADIAKTVDFIKEKKVKAIFVETSVAKAAIERISEDSGARIGGELFSDAMGLPGEMESGPDGERYDLGTYRGMLMHNINTIVGSLRRENIVSQ